MKILDLSAGNRAIWFDKNHPFATFLDKRAEVEPHFVCDSTNIPVEVGQDFDLIVFDPPHENCGPNSEMSARYGHSTRDEIIRTIAGSGAEAYRVSKPGALLAFKWNDHAYSLNRALSLMPQWEPLFGHHLKNRGGADTKSQSFWVLLRKREPGFENVLPDFSK